MLNFVIEILELICQRRQFNSIAHLVEQKIEKLIKYIYPKFVSLNLDERKKLKDELKILEAFTSSETHQVLWKNEVILKHIFHWIVFKVKVFDYSKKKYFHSTNTLFFSIHTSL